MNTFLANPVENTVKIIMLIVALIVLYKEFMRLWKML